MNFPSRVSSVFAFNQISPPLSILEGKKAKAEELLTRASILSLKPNRRVPNELSVSFTSLTLILVTFDHLIKAAEFFSA